MNTFLPYKSYTKSAVSLDNKRLGKQRVEVLQILKTLAGLSSGWKNHPAVKMWKGHEQSLALYGKVICTEWKRRGFKDTCHEKIQALSELFPPQVFDYPPWLTDDFCLRHQSNLVRKDPDFYFCQFGVTGDLDYIWPSKEEEK